MGVRFSYKSSHVVDGRQVYSSKKCRHNSQLENIHGKPAPFSGNHSNTDFHLTMLGNLTT